MTGEAGDRVELKNERLEGLAIHHAVDAGKGAAPQNPVGFETQLLHPGEQIRRIIEVKEILSVVVNVLGLVVVKLPLRADFTNGQGLIAQNSNREFDPVDVLFDEGLAITIDNQRSGGFQGMERSNDAGIDAAAG